MTKTLDVAPLTDDLVIVERLDGSRWTARGTWARIALVAWYALPVLAAFAVTSVAARTIGRPSGIVDQLAWFAGLSVVASLVVHAAQQALRSLLPLAALLSLDLAFPGRAPRRFGIALRAGNPRPLLGRLDQTHAMQAPKEAADLLLELVGRLSFHDKALRGHSERVRAYSELVAEELGLDRSGRDGLRWAGLLHDVGKLEVPASILNKTDPLTEAEWSVIRQHPVAGAQLCASLTPWLGEWASGVLDHHERWEGGGYPRGIAGTEISLAGRVVAVTDAFDVMTSARSYQSPRSVEDARAELVRCSGTQFDPMVVRAFLSISVPKLRSLTGGIGAAALSELRHRLPAVAGLVERAAVAACVACVAGLLAPMGGDDAAPQSASPTIDGARSERPGQGTTPEDSNGRSGAGAADDDPTETRSPNAGSGDPLPRTRGGSPVLPRPPGDRRGPGGPGGPGGPRDDGPGPPSDPGNSGVTIIVDPADGSVAVDGLGTPAAPPVTIVEVPAAGQAACQAAGVCRPITITVPLSGP